MKKILATVIFTLFWSTITYAKNISYICEVTDNRNSKPYKEIFEIKNNKFFSDGEKLKTTFIKINDINVEVNYHFGSSDIEHRVNLKNGSGFEIWKSDKNPTSTVLLKCIVI